MDGSEQLTLPTSGTIPHQATPTPRGSQRAGTPPPPRVTLTIDEAATALGISRDHLERHVLRDLRIIYSGRRRLIPIRELDRWADQHAVAAARRGL